MHVSIVHPSLSLCSPFAVKHAGFPFPMPVSIVHSSLSLCLYSLVLFLIVAALPRNMCVCYPPLCMGSLKILTGHGFLLPKGVGCVGAEWSRSMYFDARASYGEFLPVYMCLCVGGGSLTSYRILKFEVSWVRNRTRLKQRHFNPRKCLKFSL